MFRKTRIRSLIAISALTGATVLGGAGLAGAESHPTDEEAAEIVELDETLETTQDDEETGEEEAADDAETDDAETDDADTDTETDETETDETETETDDAETDDAETETETGDAETETETDDADDADDATHGQAVSEAAHACQEDHSGYDNRGQCVREVAHSDHGEQSEETEETEEEAGEQIGEPTDDGQDVEAQADSTEDRERGNAKADTATAGSQAEQGSRQG